jgi:hypothetical protein
MFYCLKKKMVTMTRREDKHSNLFLEWGRFGRIIDILVDEAQDRLVCAISLLDSPEKIIVRVYKLSTYFTLDESRGRLVDTKCEIEYIRNRPPAEGCDEYPDIERLDKCVRFHRPLKVGRTFLTLPTGGPDSVVFRCCWGDRTRVKYGGVEFYLLGQVVCAAMISNEIMVVSTEYGDSDFGSYDYLLFVELATGNVFKQIKHECGSRLRSMVVPKEGTVWVSADNKIVSYEIPEICSRETESEAS